MEGDFLIEQGESEKEILSPTSPEDLDGKGIRNTFSRDVRLGLHRVATALLLMAGDLVAFWISLGMSYVLRSKLLGELFPLPFSQTFFDLISRLWMPAVFVGAYLFDGMYSRRMPFWEETRQLVRSSFFATVALLAIVTLGKMSNELSRAIVLGTGALSLFIVPLVRYFWKPFLHQKGLGLKKTILVGDNIWGRLAHLGLFRDHYMGIRIVGEVEITRESGRCGGAASRSETLLGREAPDVPRLGTLSDLVHIVERHEIRAAVVALPDMRREDLVAIIDEVQKNVLSVYLVPNIAQVNLVNSELLYLFYEEIFLLGIHNALKSRLNRWIKNASDGALAVFLAIPLLPVIGVIALLVALDSPGPVFFSQTRVGPGKKAFRIFKFRTMVEGAEGLLAKMLSENPDFRREFSESQKIALDPRITRMGKFLRKTSLDELPQIFNVLRGEMSFVGPRPVTFEELDVRYKNNGAIYALVKPGISGLWQVSGRSELGYEVRIRLDLWYVRNWSLWLDLVILIRTLGVVFGRKGSW